MMVRLFILCCILLFVLLTRFIMLFFLSLVCFILVGLISMILCEFFSLCRWLLWL